MNYRKLAVMMMTLSFVLIISGGVSSFIIGLKEDHEETYNRMYKVSDEFEVFSTNTSVFESVRDELYNVVLSNVYYDTMYQEDKDVKNKLSNYENLVDELTKNTNNLDKLCSNMYYSDKEVNSKCVNYKSIYEQVVNYFVSDIKVYNDNVAKYNKYQEENNSELKISMYKTDKKYIDYNNDKKFDGKEE